MNNIGSAPLEQLSAPEPAVQSRALRVANMLSDTLRETRDEIQCDPGITAYDKREVERQLVRAVMQREALKLQELRHPRP